MLEINENTRLLFIEAVNDINRSLESYAKKEDANKSYIKKRNRQIQDLFNFYNEAETVLENRKFNREVFVINGGQDAAEISRLRAENRQLKEQLKGMYPKKRYYNNAADREAFRSAHNARQREIFNF